MNYIFIVLSFFFVFNLSLAQNCNDLRGKWQNQNGSILHITEVSGQSQLSGNYLSHEGTDAVAFPLVGWIQSKNERRPISFTVHWKENKTLTAWTGYCDASDTTIYTLWHHINPETEFEYERWSTQASEFVPLKNE